MSTAGVPVAAQRAATPTMRTRESSTFACWRAASHAASSSVNGEPVGPGHVTHATFEGGGGCDGPAAEAGALSAMRSGGSVELIPVSHGSQCILRTHGAEIDETAIEKKMQAILCATRTGPRRRACRVSWTSSGPRCAGGRASLPPTRPPRRAALQRSSALPTPTPAPAPHAFHPAALPPHHPHAGRACRGGTTPASQQKKEDLAPSPEG